MTYAADELQENKDEQGISDVIVSCKGSWQKRGHCSLNGVTLVLLLDNQSKGKTVYEFKKAVGAVLFHCSEASNLDTRHQMCPRSSESWCKFQADKINNTGLYKNKPRLIAKCCQGCY